MASIDAIQSLLQTAFSAESIDIVDESQLHSRHYKSNSVDPTHLKIRIVSAAFNGISKVKQHQMVHRVLESAFADGLHALALEIIPAGQDRL